MPHALKTLVLVALAAWVLPQAVLAVEPNVGIDTKSNAQSGPPDRTCVQVPDKYQTAGPFTVQELEEKLEGSVPRVPFEKASAEWKEFLRQLRKGDELFMYDEGCCTGIIIVRKSCIVDWFPISDS